MNEHDGETERSVFLTIESALAVHERFLDSDNKRADREMVARFVDALITSGAYFSEASKRNVLQATLDYWTSELARNATDKVRSGRTRRAIDTFDADVLRALQDDFDNPFAGIASRISPEELLSSAALIEIVEKQAERNQISFEDGLLKEIASQLAHDPDGAKLLEFCLWHLFEDSSTRWGNKIYRPYKARKENGRLEYFSCKVFCERKTQKLYEGLEQAEKDEVVDSLLALTTANPGKRIPNTARQDSNNDDETARQGTSFVLYGKNLPSVSQFLLESRLAFDGDGGVELVHPVLQERWRPFIEKELHLKEQEKNRKREARRKAQRFFMWKVAAVSFVLVVGLVCALEWVLTTRASARLGDDRNGLSKILAARLEGLNAARWSLTFDESYARNVVNDEIARVIGNLAREGDLYGLPAHPRVIRTNCELVKQIQSGFLYTITVPQRQGEAIRLGSSSSCPTFAINDDGTFLAVAWETLDDSGDTGVVLKVFDISNNNLPTRIARARGLDAMDLTQDAEWISKLTKVGDSEKMMQGDAKEIEKNAPCFFRSTAIRFSEDDRIVSFECLYFQPETKSVALRLVLAQTNAPESGSNRNFEASVRSVETVGRLVEDPASASGECPPGTEDAERARAVFLGSQGLQGLRHIVTVGGGYLNVWQPDARSQCWRSNALFSDFVRMRAQRPTDVAVSEYAEYAVYASEPSPVIRVFEDRKPQQALLMEHYPPQGVGTPISVRFTSTKRCIRVRTTRSRPKKVIEGAEDSVQTTQAQSELVRLDYFLILDTSALLAIGKALVRDLDGDTVDGAIEGSLLNTYDGALQEHCGIVH